MMQQRTMYKKLGREIRHYRVARKMLTQMDLSCRVLPAQRTVHQSSRGLRQGSLSAHPTQPLRDSQWAGDVEFCHLQV